MSKDQVNRVARQTGFVKIDSALDGATFLKLLLYNSEKDRNLSLNQLSLEVSNEQGKTLSKQAIDSRFTEKSIHFIKTIFETYLKNKNQLLASKDELGWMNLFKRVLVKDGTRFDLPEAYASHFKGYGGSCSSDSAVCVQFEYDLKTGKIAELKLTSANIPDCKDAQLTQENIQAGDLILRDLGYFNLNIFENITKNDAYYISKLNANVSVFTFKNNKYTPLNFKQLYQEINQKNIKTMELDVYIGKDKKMPTRLIIEQISHEVYEQRIIKNKKYNQRKGFSMKEEYANRRHFNLYVTNISKGILPTIAIKNIYRMRWQVELVFKQWKSTYKIDKTHKMKFERWITLFYARLLLMLINWKIYYTVKQIKYKRENKLLSLSKCLQSLKLASYKITKLINQNLTSYEKTIQELLQILYTKHDLEKKKGRKNQEEIIDIIYCISSK